MTSVYEISERCPLSGIVKIRKHNVSELDLCPSPTLSGLLESATLNRWKPMSAQVPQTKLSRRENAKQNGDGACKDLKLS
jgi:hypothetical protein